MRSRFFYSIVLALSSFAYAQDPRPYQTGKVLQMDSVPCAHRAGTSPESLCHEYVLESDTVVFHIRPAHGKNSILLPVGERAQFRIDKGKLLLWMEGVENKDRPYVVISISPRLESSAANATSVRLNHLQ